MLLSTPSFPANRLSSSSPTWYTRRCGFHSFARPCRPKNLPRVMGRRKRYRARTKNSSRIRGLTASSDLSSIAPKFSVKKKQLDALVCRYIGQVATSHPKHLSSLQINYLSHWWKIYCLSVGWYSENAPSFALSESVPKPWSLLQI